MAITLAEAKVGMADKVDQMIVDEFRRSSLLLDRLVFDNAISPGTGGSTLTYGYIQLQTPSTAAVRAINAEYTAGEAKRVEKTAKAVIMGGSFEVDRVLQNTSGAVDELAFQAQQKIKATSNYFHNLVINGTSASSGAGYVANTFDGLKKALAGTTNEFTTDIDLSDSTKLDSNSNAFIDQLDQLVHAIDGDASMLLMNGDMLLKVRAAARRAGGAPVCGHAHPGQGEQHALHAAQRGGAAGFPSGAAYPRHTAGRCGDLPLPGTLLGSVAPGAAVLRQARGGAAGGNGGDHRGRGAYQR